MANKAALLGQGSAALKTAGCVSADCFCLLGDDDKCVAVLHVDDGRPCVCYTDKDGNTKHVKLDDLFAK